MKKKIINTKDAPAPIGPYSQAVRTGNLLFISGQIALIAGTDLLANLSIAEETEQVMKNLQSILKAEDVDFKEELIPKKQIGFSGRSNS
jgi:2-iminobutanoate/2-iminopropanoate deaminase